MALALVFFLGIVAVGIGVLMLWVGWSGRREANRLANLEALSAVGVETSPSGTEGYLVGRLALDNPQLEHGLVLLTRSRLSGFRKEDDGRRVPRWESFERRWPSPT